MQGYAGNGSLGIPQFYLVDAEGKVVGDAPPTEAELEKLLADVVDLKLDRKLDPALAEAEQAYLSGLLGHAFATAGKHLDDKQSAAAKDALYLRQKVEEADGHRKKRAASELAGLAVDKAYGKLLEWKYDHAGLPLGKWASAQLDAMKKDRDKQKQLRADAMAWSRLEAVLKREPRALSKDFERSAVERLYKELGGKYGRTAAGAIAKRRLKNLSR